ncbi:DUF2303 family protein [Pseudomonas sp. F1_0610]|uniref:DUF2303 family protein n=1 Tax=Pseudomonas sp. F1_0610 TaxID=3114284 RepID=UPI0039C458A2
MQNTDLTNAIAQVSALAITADTETNKYIANMADGIIALPENILVNDLENYMPQRRSFRGNFNTSSIENFAYYVNQQDTATVFIDLESPTLNAKAIFDLGDVEEPGHCRHTSQLSLKPTAVFAAVQQINGNPVNQQKLAEFLEDWQDHIQAVADGEEVNIYKALAAVRNVTIEKINKSDFIERDFGQTTSAMDQIEAKSIERLPGYLHVRLTPHEGLAEIVIKLRVGIQTNAEKPTFVLRWMQEDAVREAIGQDLKRVLHERIEGKDMLIGTFNSK